MIQLGTGASVSQILFSPLLDWPWLLAVAVILLLSALLTWRLQRRGGIWRFGFALLAVLALANPQYLRAERELQPDIALLIIDESESQKLGLRLDAAREAAQELMASRERDDTLDWQIVTLINNANEDGTQLFSAIANAANSIPSARLAGVIAVTDGLAHDAMPDHLAERLAAPVHVLLTGDPNLRDRRLVIEQAPRFAVVGRPVDIRLRVEEDGEVISDDALVTWWRGGEIAGQRLLPLSKSTTITLTPQHAGQNLIRLQAETLPGEITTLNNQALISINGVRDRLRVLLISGEPHAGERLWRGTLKSDPAVDLVHFTILRLPTSIGAAPLGELALIPFPTQQLFEEKLHEFNLVIFDRYSLRGVLLPRYLENLAAFVRQGGAVLAAVGPEFADAMNLSQTALGDILPVRPLGGLIERGFTPTLTALGQRHPVTAPLNGADGQRKWGRWFHQIPVRADAEASVLMNGAEGQALLVLNHVDEGRVAVLLSDQLWLWGRGVDGGGPHGELIRRLAHWLMKEPELEEESLRAEARGSDIHIERQSLQNNPISITITAPDGTVQNVPLEASNAGKSAALFTAPAPGLYEISDGQSTVSVMAGLVDRLELAKLAPTQEILAPLAAQSGGGMFWLKDGLPQIRRIDGGDRAYGRNWLGLKENRSGPLSGVSQTALLPPWAMLAMMLALLAFSWFRESR